MRRLIYIYLLLVIPLISIGQTKNKNFVITQKIRKEGLSPVDLINSNFPPLEVIEQISYFDGLGRPTQKIQVGISPKERDIISPIKYDATGRITKQYLPFTKANGGAFDNDVFAAQEFFYLTEGKIANTNFAYSEIKYDNSPFNKVVEISAPGYAWSMNQGHTQEMDYKLNDSNSEILFFTYDYTSGNGTSTGYHTAGTLKLLEHFDEDDNKSVSFTDAWGKVITNAKIDNTGETQKVHTYYIYDDFGQLRYVIPPEGLKQLYATNGNYNFARNDAVCDDYFFWYEYDEKHRIIKKKEPGKDVIYIVYDELDRPVLTQDGIQRAYNRWSFIKYDKHSRPIQTGIHMVSGSLTTVQSNVNVFYSSAAVPNYEELISNQGLLEYSNVSFPTTNLQTTVYKEIYYDNYDFDITNSFPFVQEEQISSNVDRVKGYMTGSKTRILNSSPAEWLYNVYYFDEYGRAIQTITQNHLEGFDRFSSLIKFDGQTTNSIHTHVIFDGDPTKEKITIQYRDYGYDHAGRLMTVDHTVNNGSPVRMVSNSYNELGQLVEKNLHDMQEEGCLQSVDYKYNIRGWLKRINSANLNNNNNLIDLEEIVAATEQVDGMRLDTIIFEVASYKNGVVSSLTIEVNDSKSLQISKIDDPTDIRYCNVGESSSFEIYDNIIDIGEFTALHERLGQQITLNMGQLMFSESFDRQTMLVAVNDKVVAQLEELKIKDELLITAITRQVSNYFAKRIDIVYFNEDNNDLFGMDLYYNEGLSDLEGHMLFDGKISGMQWQTTVNSGIRAYGFQFDELDRLTQAKYGEYTNYNWDMENKFGLNINQYDLNGNIEELERYGVVGNSGGNDLYGLMDNLEYFYNGNQLDELNDFVTNLTFESNDFRDNGSNTTGEYGYDANGNLIKDDNKGITNIEYNYINQPELVEFGTTKKIEYLYTAEGAKLQMKIIDGTNITTLDYSSGFVYTNELVDYILTEEGRLTPSSGSNPFVYEYFIKDHLGNVRVSFSDYNNDGVGEILQENHYYPFGLTFGGLDYVSPISSENLYQYNGKENQQAHNLAWVDYGFRMYDPQIARWHVVDALAEKYFDLTPYNYVGNDPIGRYDLLGLDMAAFDIKQQNGSRRIGPGSGNHWSDPGRSERDNFVLGGEAAFDRMYGEGAFELGYAIWSHPKASILWRSGQINMEMVSKDNGKFWDPIAGEEVYRNTYSKEGVYYADIYYTGGYIDLTYNGGSAGGGDNSGLTLNEAATGVSAMSLSNSVKGNLVEWGMEGANWGKTGARYMKVVRGAGIAGTVFGMGVSTYNIVSDVQAGNAVNSWDVADLSVGAAGLGATIFLASNPVGWAIAGGATIYFGARFVYDISTKP